MDPFKAADIDGGNRQIPKRRSTISGVTLISLSTFPEKCKIAKLKPMFTKGSTTESKVIGQFSFFL